MAKPTAKNNDTTANLGYEAQLWQMADALRNNMDVAEYKHVVLGLIFLKYISDAFEAKHAELEAEKAQGTDPEDRDEYRAASIFWVPKDARWQLLKASAPQPTIGALGDDAMAAIERDNPTLKGVLPKDYGRPGLDKQCLGQIINLVSDISFHPSPPGRWPGVREPPTPTSPASARALPSKTSASTATCSRRAATSAPRRSRTTASRSRRRCGGWL
jgi:type I restriction enzyme M protein